MARKTAEELQVLWQEMSIYEENLRARGVRYPAGLDEAGRGPLAGPVVAAAVILPPDAYIPGLRDSKKLSEKQRLALEPEIKTQALAWAVGCVNHRLIDEINILEASKLAMIRAISRLVLPPDHLLVDAVKLPLAIPQTNIIKGDSLSVSIAAASVLAKNQRDRIMCKFAVYYPAYGLEQHKGYPSAAHKAAIAAHGLSPIHRRSFRST